MRGSEEDAVADASLTGRSALELAALVRQRDVSPVEVTQAFLERIERVNPLINAYVTVCGETALEQAREAEQAALRPGADLGPLHGVPISIKDLSATRGVRTTYCSAVFAEYIPEHNDEYVARLLGAGAILLGKTNSPEFGLNATTEDGIFPPTRNPWDVRHSAGGSSGGAGAALAARLCAFAEGSDGGGSIRIPSAACGVVGLKPSRGIVPSAPLAGEGWAGFATSGPMANTVADVALGLDVMGGPAVGDPYLIPKPGRSYLSAVGERPRRLRIAWTTETPVTDVDPEVATAVRRTAETISELGHEVVEGGPDLRDMWEPFLTIVRAHTGAMPIDRPDLLGPHARSVFEQGREISARDYLAAEQAVYQATRRVMGWFEQQDVFLCPTLTRTPPELGVLSQAGDAVWDLLRRYIPFTFWVNVTGQPAMSLPLAVASNGLPIGVQIVGRQQEEHALLALAATLEEALPWRDRRPPLE